VGDLIDGYVRELYPLKRWSGSKARDLRVLERKFGADLVGSFDHNRAVQVFTDMHADGTGGVGINTRRRSSAMMTMCRCSDFSGHDAFEIVIQSCSILVSDLSVPSLRREASVSNESWRISAQARDVRPGCPSRRLGVPPVLHGAVSRDTSIA
jgi:hypothetical protein